MTGYAATMACTARRITASPIRYRSGSRERYRMRLASSPEDRTVTLTDYSAARDTRQHRAIRAGILDRATIEAYRETLDRLRDAQARYELNRDDRASDAAVRDAIRDVLVARADLEHMRRRSVREGWSIPS